MPTLNDLRLKRLQPPETGRLELTDDKAVGLKFRLTANGRATWSVQVSVHGEKRRFTIGEYPAIGLADARKQAAKLRADALAGHDPIRERRAEAEAEKSQQTVAQVLDLYAGLYLKQLKTAGERERQLQWALADHLSKPIGGLQRHDLQAAIDAKAFEGKLGAANRIRAALIAFARWAWERGHLPEHIGAGTKRAAKEKPRERVLSLGELRAVWQATHVMGDLWGPFLRILILTAQRRGDVAGARWSEIDLDAKRWVIPGERTKNGKPHIVHLSEPALSDFTALQEKSDGDLIFTTTGTTPISGFGNMKARLEGLVGIEDWRLHDLRTAFASALCDAGEPEGVVDRCLNHAATGSAPSAVARVYNRSEMLPQRARVLDRWARMVTDAGGDLVELRPGAR
jgi:integrase